MSHFYNQRCNIGFENGHKKTDFGIYDGSVTTFSCKTIKLRNMQCNNSVTHLAMKWYIYDGKQPLLEIDMLWV